jgi:5'-nucleotidase
MHKKFPGFDNQSFDNSQASLYRNQVLNPINKEQTMKCFMKYFVILVSAFICFNTANAAKREISIIHTNDLHSHFLGFSPNQDYTPETVQDDDTIGGFARISTMIKKIKAQGKGSGRGWRRFSHGLFFPPAGPGKSL